jgi:hypothetical protein
MARIHLATDGQRLIKVEAPKIASGDRNADFLIVDFCSSWDSFAKTAVFYRREDEVYYAVLDGNNECVIPWEVLQTDGVLYMGVFGVNNDVRKTSEIITYKIDKGAIFDVVSPSDPTPDIYDQILTECQKVRDALNEYLVIGEDPPVNRPVLWFNTGDPNTEIAVLNMIDDTNTDVQANVNDREYGVDNASLNSEPTESSYSFNIE